MYDVAWRGMWICVRSKDAQKQLARTSLSCLQANREIKITQFVSKLFTTRNIRAIFEAISYIAL